MSQGAQSKALKNKHGGVGFYIDFPMGRVLKFVGRKNSIQNTESLAAPFG